MTDFKEYLRAQKEQAASTHERTASSYATEEWERLKRRVRELAEGESYNGEPFLWSPYPAPYPEFLTLGNVALSFNHRGRGRSASSDYAISFGQRPPSPSETFGSNNIHEIEYCYLEPRGSGHDFAWSAEEYKNNFSTEELAHKLLIEFLEYYKRYRPTSKTKFGK